MSIAEVLVIDDDPDTRELLAAMLERGGYRVNTARDGAEAIDMLATAEPPPDAIVTDLQMPGIIGESVVEFVRQDKRLAHSVLAVITGVPQRAPTGVRVFAKPFKATSLLRFLDDELAHRADHKKQPTSARSTSSS